MANFRAEPDLKHSAAEPRNEDNDETVPRNEDNDETVPRNEDNDETMPRNEVNEVLVCLVPRLCLVTD